MKCQERFVARVASSLLHQVVTFALLLSCVYHSANAAAIEAWVRRYNGPTGSYDFVAAVAVDKWGDVIVTGNSRRSGTGIDYYTAKYAGANGALRWEKWYHNVISEQPLAVGTDADGNVVVTGSSYNSAGNYDYYTAKYAATNGDLLWEKRYNSLANGFDEARAVAMDSGDNVVVTGISDGGASDDDFYTVKYRGIDGTILWEQRYNAPANSNDTVSAIVVDRNDNVVVTGSSFAGGAFDYYTAMYAALDGSLIWDKRYNGPANSNDTASAVAVDGLGNVIVTGSSRNAGGNSDIYTAKYAAASGDLIWEQRHNGPGNNNDAANAVAVDEFDNVIVTGSSRSANADYYTVKYASGNGSILWEKRYNGAGSGNDFPRAMALDKRGNVVITGQSMGIGSANDFVTLKYASQDGTLLWEKRYNGPANRDDTMAFGSRSVAIGPNNEVAIAGSSLDGADLSDYATVVYWETLPAILIETVPDGVRLTVTGPAGRTNLIERSPLVSGPWNLIASPIASPSGLVVYTDTNSSIAAVFYRARTP